MGAPFGGREYCFGPERVHEFDFDGRSIVPGIRLERGEFYGGGLNQQGDPELNTQIRFHLIFARDSNLYVVYSDQRRKLTTGDVAVDQAMQMKMTYRLYW